MKKNKNPAHQTMFGTTFGAYSNKNNVVVRNNQNTQSIQDSIHSIGDSIEIDDKNELVNLGKIYDQNIDTDFTNQSLTNLNN